MRSERVDSYRVLADQQLGSLYVDGLGDLSRLRLHCGNLKSDMSLILSYDPFRDRGQEKKRGSSIIRISVKDTDWMAAF